MTKRFFVEFPVTVEEENGERRTMLLRVATFGNSHEEALRMVGLGMGALPTDPTPTKREGP